MLTVFLPIIVAVAMFWTTYLPIVVTNTTSERLPIEAMTMFEDGAGSITVGGMTYAVCVNEVAGECEDQTAALPDVMFEDGSVIWTLPNGDTAAACLADEDWNDYICSK